MGVWLNLSPWSHSPPLRTDLTVATALVRKAASRSGAALAPVVETGESVRTWGLVPDTIVMGCTGLCTAHRYGVVVHGRTRENSEYGLNFNQTP